MHTHDQDKDGGWSQAWVHCVPRELVCQRCLALGVAREPLLLALLPGAASAIHLTGCLSPLSRFGVTGVLAQVGALGGSPLRKEGKNKSSEMGPSPPRSMRSEVAKAHLMSLLGGLDLISAQGGMGGEEQQTFD